LTGEVLDKFAQLITTALGLVAALAWNTAIQNLFDKVFGKAGAALAGQFLYAILITLVVIFATIAVSRAAERAKKAEAERHGGAENRNEDRQTLVGTGFKPAQNGTNRGGRGSCANGPYLFEIVRGDAVHPILELVHDLFFGGFLHRLFEDDAGLLYHFV
jgi:uncharacterized membrane protein